MKIKSLSNSILLFILVSLLSTLIASQAFSGEPPKKPILRIETGMHAALIQRIAVDASGRWLVTASHDKSLRVWELPSGRHVRIIRPPIGDDCEGRLESVAISSDGNTIACGGWTQFNNGQLSLASDGMTIYLFNRANGEMIGRLTGLPEVIRHLAFTPDGRYLAAMLGAGNGIRLYRTADWSLADKDTDYGSNSYSAHFSRDGRLVTTSLDGYVRLYDIGKGSLQLIKKVKAPGGSQPYSARFSPDGSRVAVGYHDTTNISVLSARDLSLVYSPDTGGTKNGENPNLMNVAWSADGRYLFASGRSPMQFGSVWKGAVRWWSDGGRGSYTDTAAADNTILDLAPLPDGRIAFGAGNPAFGILDQSDKRALFVSHYIADYRDNWEGFRVSGDGGMVSFGYELWGRSPASFDLQSRRLTMGEAGGTLQPPITKSDGLTIDGWKNTYEPKLNGAPLKLKQYEESRSMAIAPDKGSFILGTEWYLRRFNRQGNQLWAAPIPGVAWGVNVSGNGKVVLAAFGDGTIRWYRMSDGKELMAFFPHADKKRWILWTPSGYFDASVGGEDLIGWHVNRGKDKAADFFPASRFRDSYYRPDIVAKVLSTLDEAEAVRLADAARGTTKGAPEISKILPPVINILDQTDSVISATSNTVTLRYKLTYPSDAPVTSVRAQVNARPVPTPKGIPVKTGDKDVQEITVTIPEENCEISLIAENRNSLSVPATVRVLWKGKPQGAAPLPRLLILAVGVGKYEEKALKLIYAAKDADDFNEVLRQQEGIVYSKVISHVITDSKAKKDDILDGLDWLKKETTSRDIAVIFMSGHGVNDTAGLYYFLPQNAVSENLTRTGLGLSSIKDTVASLPGKVILFLDTCHAGSVDLNGIINTLTGAGVGAVVFSSSTGEQKSLEGKDWENGVFTKALVEGLYGKADYGRGKITVTGLDMYVSDRVKELTKEQQTPVVGKPTTVADFEIARKKLEKP